MSRKQVYGGIDYFRVIAAVLVISIHVLDEFLLTRTVARAAVPFFFMATGYFVLPHAENKENGNAPLIRFLVNTGKLYGIAVLLYLPVNLYSGNFAQEFAPSEILRSFLIGGTFYHLWYLPAVLIGTALVWFLIRYLKPVHVYSITVGLYVLGLAGDSYYGLVSQVPVLRSAAAFLVACFGYTRNGFFFAPVFLAAGYFVYKKGKAGAVKSTAGTIIFLCLMTVEAYLLKRYTEPMHDAMYVMLIPCMYFLFQRLLLIKRRCPAGARDFSMLLYILHPICIIIVRGAAKVIRMEWLFVDNTWIQFVCVTVASALLSGICFFIMNRRKKVGFSQNRAWIEIDKRSLGNNVRVLKSALPGKCNLMAVIKANAYGHGDIEVGKYLNKIGIEDFAVATVSEAVNLRRQGLRGRILIFGYTHPDDFHYLVRYKLIQTVLDGSYAEELDAYGRKIAVHIKIDTGMHRLGENCCNMENIRQIYECRNLDIQGIYTHLSVADSQREEDEQFTRQQIENFYHTEEQIRAMGYDTGKLHIQSSYGVLNYPELVCDYARLGIILYGVLSGTDKTKRMPKLRPVLSLKARISLVRELQPGEAVGYGRAYVADSERKIAVVAVGYADGVPRNLSGNNGQVLIHGHFAPVIGRVCMDQMMVDVTHIPEVKSGDVATVIGNEGTRELSVETVAENCGTITNELLSRLGQRLERVYIG